MLIRLTAVGALVCVATSAALAQRQLTLIATVVDPNGAEVTNLDAKEVRVLENGVEGKVLTVEPIERVPKLQVLIDNGVGMPAESTADLRKGIRALLDALPPDVEVTLVTTAPQPRFLERATKDRQKQLTAIDRIAPDSGAGRFVESLYEATTRIQQDKQQDASYTILTIGTSSGDGNVRDRDVKQAMERIQQRRTTVYAIVLQSAGRSAGGGFIQSEVAQAAAGATGGRFENITVANRLATLLPEMAAQIATSMSAGAKQFRITAERPSGASGDVGKLSMGVAGKVLAALSLEP